MKTFLGRSAFWFLHSSFFVLHLSASAATNDLTSALQRGLFEEEANHNLEAAAQAYQAVSARFDQDRKLAATAIFRLGEVYRKQGRTNEAAAQFERIVREFSDQPTLLTLSRQNLGGLIARGGVLPGMATTGTGSDAAILEQIKQLSATEIRQVLPTLVPDDLLTKLLSEYQTAEANRARIANDFSPLHPQMVNQDNLLKNLNGQIQNRIAGIIKALEIRAGSGAAKEPIAGSGSPPTDDEEKEIRLIQAMIQNSPDLINAAGGGDRMTPLSRAASRGQLRVAAFLLDHGADINRGGPLFSAAVGGHKTMVEFLLRRGADVNATSNGQTALHQAAEYGFLSVTEALLAGKADPNLRDVSSRTPLALAANRGFLPVVAALLAHSADPNLVSIVKPGYGTNPVAEGRTMFGAPLHFAAIRGDAAMTTLLLSNSADVKVLSIYNETPLYVAAALGKTNVAELLLAAGADPNVRRFDNAATPLVEAVWSGHRDMVKLLLEHGANPNVAVLAGQAGVTPLMSAVSQKDPELVALLLKYKADPNPADARGNTALGNAVLSRSPGTVRALLEAGAKSEAHAGSGTPVLWFAISTDNADCVDVLLAHGADTEIMVNGAYTSLRTAVERGIKRVVEALLKAGAKVNAQGGGRDGRTALHQAVEFRDRELTTLLLEHEANPNLRDASGQTPLDLTKARFAPPGQGRSPLRGNQPPAAQKDLADLLRQHGALDELPFFDRIEVRRAGFSAVAFQISTNGWNEFRLLELIALHYGFLYTDRNAVWEVNKSSLPSKIWSAAACQFPDLGRVVIRRPDKNGPRWAATPVDASALLDSGDCSRDVRLQPGDIVEIPEADHPVNEKWAGLPELQLSNLLNCVSRNITISVKGTSTSVQLAPAFKPTNGLGALTKGSFMLKSVLAQSRLLRASSDVSLVKVTRRVAGKALEWVLNCDTGSDPDLWLRDGDVIEVPDKP